MIEMTDIAWAAGFMEGDGSFLMGKPYVASPNGSLRVVAGQVQRQPLEKMYSIFGGHIYDYKKPRKEKWNKFSMWYANGARAAAIMMTLYSYMSPKRKQQIETALSRWKAAPFPKGSTLDEYCMLSPAAVAMLEANRADETITVEALSRTYGMHTGKVKNILRLKGRVASC